MTLTDHRRIDAAPQHTYETRVSAQLATFLSDAAALELLGSEVSIESHSGTVASLVFDNRLLEVRAMALTDLPAVGDRVDVPSQSSASHFLLTDFDEYVLGVANHEKDKVEMRWRGSSTRFEAVLRLSGGIVRLAEDSDWALISRSVAIDLPTGSNLSSGQYRVDKFSRGPRRLNALNATGFQLRNILDVWSSLFPGQDVPLEERKEGSQITRLRTLTPVRSSAVAFVTETASPSRGDFISSYCTPSSGETFREFLVDEVEDSSVYSGALRELQLNILYLLAVRRTKLFRAKYAARVYTVSLPPGLLHADSDSPVAVLPIVTATRLPRAKRFRTTVGLTLVTVPVALRDDGSLVARKPGHSEVAWLTDELQSAGGMRPEAGNLTLEGPLNAYLAREDEAWSVSSLFRAVAIKSAESATGGRVRRASAQARALAGLRQSTMGSVCYLVDWRAVDGPPWSDWSAGCDDEAIRELLHRAVFRSDHAGGADASSTRASVDFRGLSIGNAYGTDIMGMTIFNPQDDTKYVLFPIDAEQYPNNSVLRWMTWQVYLDVAVAAVRSLLGRFHDGVDTASDLRRVLRSVQKLTAELAEVYDLDLSDFYYRREFEALRRVMHLDDDYEYMRQRLEGAQGEASLREQILMNNLVLALTISGVVGTVIVAIGESRDWSIAGYVGATVAALVASLAISFGLFEPLRRVSSRLRSAIAARRR